MSRQYATGLAIVVLVTAGAVALWQLITVEFESGEMFPPYSSLRSDPLGAKALYKSLESLPGLQVSRHHRPLGDLDIDRATIIVGGVRAADSPLAEATGRSREWKIAELAALAHRGCRVVIALRSDAVMSQFDHDRPRTTPANWDETEPDQSHEWHDPDQQRAWSYFLDLPLTTIATNDGFAVRATDETSLPPLMTCHTTAAFVDPPAGWRAVYEISGPSPADTDAEPECETGAVIVERRYGSGTIVLCTDSYWLSNEALRQDRQPGLLLWILGGNRRIVFDEHYHGMRSQRNLMILARSYRLHGFFAALLLLTGLYIWRAGSSLLPPLAETSPQQSTRVAGRDIASGQNNLLQRHLPLPRLLGVCLARWQASADRLRQVTPAQLAAMRELAATEVKGRDRDRRIVEIYRRLAEIAAGKEQP